MKSLIERLWESYDTHCDLAIKTQEQGWDIAYQYHKRRAEEYLALINALIKQREEKQLCF